MLEMKALAEATALIVKEHVAAAVTPLLARIETLEKADNVLILRLVQDEVAKIPPALDGKDADPEALSALIDEKVTAAVDAIPKPHNGKSITVEDVAPLIATEIERAVSERPLPTNVANALIDRNGCLVLSLSDGTQRDLGVVVGKDGQDGTNGADGASGSDGSDGLGFDDLEIVHDGERGFTFKLMQGERVKEFPFTLPVVLDRGVYKAGDTYQAGDGVTWGGSYWIAKTETDAKPDGGTDWRLSIKRGRDGKDAK